MQSVKIFPALTLTLNIIHFDFMQNETDQSEENRTCQSAPHTLRINTAMKLLVPNTISYDCYCC